MGPNAVARFKEIAENVKEDGLRSKIPVSYIRDLLNLFVTTDVADYVLKRSKVNDLGRDLDNGELQQIRADLGDFYHRTGAKNKNKPNLNISAFVPPPESEIYLPYYTREENPSDTAAIASVTKTRTKTGKEGGIDLNFQPQFIERFSQTGFTPVQETVITDMPDDFKGFNFNIVSFTSNLTVNGALQLMFSPK